MARPERLAGTKGLLLLKAGDVESNPGPTLGESGKGTCIKITVCKVAHVK